MFSMDQLRRTLGASAGRECAHCAMPFDRDPPNCPACGYTETVPQ